MFDSSVPFDHQGVVVSKETATALTLELPRNLTDMLLDGVELALYAIEVEPDVYELHVETMHPVYCVNLPTGERVVYEVPPDEVDEYLEDE